MVLTQFECAGIPNMPHPLDAPYKHHCVEPIIQYCGHFEPVADVTGSEWPLFAMQKHTKM